MSLLLELHPEAASAKCDAGATPLAVAYAAPAAVVRALLEAAPEIASATSLYAGANWMERETYDFYGVRFQGHPNLKRILNVDHMEIFPMLKQYPLEDSSREDKDDRFFGR